jgi:PAS domain-containing protein
MLSTCHFLIQDLAGAKLECDRLRAEVRAAHEAWDHLFEIVPGACLLADASGWIVDANRLAALLLNVSAKHLKGRELRIFAEDRAAFGTLLRQLVHSGDGEARATLTFRPRERKPTEMDLVIRPLFGEYEGKWIWFLRASTESFFVCDSPSARPLDGRQVDVNASRAAIGEASVHAAVTDRATRVRQYATTRE